jgi:hypothetical protein
VFVAIREKLVESNGVSRLLVISSETSSFEEQDLVVKVLETGHKNHDALCSIVGGTTTHCPDFRLRALRTSAGSEWRKHFCEHCCSKRLFVASRVRK